MDASADQFVTSYVAAMQGKGMDLDRLVTEPSGLTANAMMEAFAHPDLGRLGITLMADFMAPEASIYYDAIFGAYHGQRAIRGWLVPAMADVSPAPSTGDGRGARHGDRSTAAPPTMAARGMDYRCLVQRSSLVGSGNSVG